MGESLDAHLFYITAALASAVFVAGSALLLYFLLPLVRDARDMMAKIRQAAEEIEMDFENLKGAVEEEGAKTKAVADVILGFATRALVLPPPRRKRRKARTVAK